jgi:hypothetical protein
MSSIGRRACFDETVLRLAGDGDDAVPPGEGERLDAVLSAVQILLGEELAHRIVRGERQVGSVA